MKSCFDCRFYDGTDVNDYESTYFCAYEYNRQIVLDKKTGLVYQKYKCKDFLYRTTANVRFRWLKSIFTQIAKATSYIRKRCRK